MIRGLFITFEGGEGVGKSTQAQMLAAAQRARGQEVLLTREPGGTPGAELIRQLLLDPESPDWGPRAEALLFAAARADHIAKAIVPALATGSWVICDRFLDSTRAYQGGEGELTDGEILALHTAGAGGLMPDRTILLTAPENHIARRLSLRDGDNSDRIGGRNASFHARVAARFASLAAADPERFVTIDATGTATEVHTRVLHALGISAPVE